MYSKLISAILGGMLAGIPLFANEVIYSLPAHDGKTISVEDSQKGVYFPRMKTCHWAPDGTLSTERIAVKPRRYALPKSSTPGISYGTSVSRNEFGIDRGVFPSPDGSRLAVYRKDERAVSIFPLLDITSRTGSLKVIPYPMNGMASEKIDLCVCDTLGNILTTLQVTDFTDERYLTGVSWSADSRNIFVQVLDRSQHHMHLNMYRASDGSFVRTILTEDNEAWVEPQDPLWPVGDGFFIYRTDNRSGWKNLFLCDTLGNVKRISDKPADVAYIGQAPCKDGVWVYYTSAEFSPVENHLMRVKLSRLKSVAATKIGKPERLTTERGWHSVSLSPDGSRFIDAWSSVGVPGCIDIRNSDGTLVERFSTAPDPLQDVKVPEVEFGKVRAADPRFDNYYRFFKPVDFDPAKKYPLIVYVYGGPHSQMVQDRWLGGIRMWELVMAQKGYAVYVQDNRGTQNRGAAFEKAINRFCGHSESEDQLAGLEELLERCPWIDRERIGVHGWSYGGFMTITLATKSPDTFKVAVAGGPVIDWKWYEVMYGERYMDTMETNESGFAKSSLLDKAGRLKAKLLICQGAIDDTVVWEHSLSFVQACIDAGVQLDYFPYPTSYHNMTGKARIHLYEKITDYFVENL